MKQKGSAHVINVFGKYIIKIEEKDGGGKKGGMKEFEKQQKSILCFKKS